MEPDQKSQSQRSDRRGGGTNNGGGQGKARRKGKAVKRVGPQSVTAFVPPMVTQARLAYVGELQLISWQAHEDAHNEVAGIERDVARGAQVEDGPLEFNRKTRMVRTKKVKVG